MKEPLWIREIEALAMHDQQLSLFGGPEGVRDYGLLESALARPKNVWAYAENRPSLSRLAAAYAFGISSNHPFVDGNKRTALVVSFAFLDVNGREVIATQEEAFLTLLGLAAGEITEEQLTDWFERNTAPR
ncbi:type II toxin-antitoxin system death-on-curing family toxin [Occallatibacter riparius]|uniref:Type II toxin-antitoxin system death-on-curing family toxin n=1 Tax=Occallatibacter riparius TaxID=1002689 RepID=A0A9J7BTL5_9BACT|nr:type II toxin-antitoxin system death-on-curing family toxin [Occallatibacter riparius]UWZ85975.1 type II toxin-antitoxin system death-on-curing family toxin [Occallatibacter riparius]